MAATVRIVPQGEIAKGTAEPPAIKLADPASFFSRRAARFRSLATGEPGYLGLMAELADAQQAALAAQPVPQPLLAQRLEQCRSHGLPPLGKLEERAPAWRDALHLIGRRVAPRVPDAVAGLLRGLSTASEGFLEKLADRILAFDYPGLDARVVPFVGAALQVHWVRRAAALDEGDLKPLDVPNVCPACGSPPVASALRTDIPAPGSRYLHCVLCGTDWHYARGRCTQCEARDKVAYFHIEGGSEVVKAEACDECRGYLKVLNQEKDPLADPVADDLATLSLDLLMDESGYERASPNLLFVPGQT
jgi:FdhE protein